MKISLNQLNAQSFSLPKAILGLLLLSLIFFSLILTTHNSSPTFTKSAYAIAPQASTGGLNVYVAYAEDKESNTPNPASFPIPWNGAPNTTFLGNAIFGTTNCGALPSCYDTGAIRLDNPTNSSITLSNVTVDIHSTLAGGKVFSLWGSFTVPAGKSVILTQNPNGNNPTYINFDTSGYPKNTNCASPITVQPFVTFTINGVVSTLYDSTHVLDTGGIDVGSCQTGQKQNESFQWRPIGSAGTTTGTFTLSPTINNKVIGNVTTETATVKDGSGTQGLPNVTVNFAVISGPNAGKSGSSVTNASGHATFSYSSTLTGNDTISATIASVGTFTSNNTTVTWSNTGGVTPTPTPTISISPTATPTPTGVQSPVQLSNLHVFDTTNAANWSLQTNLQNGLVQYGDRGYLFATIPSSLLGSSWIKTANASRAYANNPTVTFAINHTATVYIAVDSRIARPTWIDTSWTLTNLALTDNQSIGHNTFNIYSKQFQTGSVNLGPNNNGINNDNMYSVIVK